MASSFLDGLKEVLGTKEKPLLPPVIMLDNHGRVTNKENDCYMWSRHGLGFGWNKPEEGKPVPKC